MQAGSTYGLRTFLRMKERLTDSIPIPANKCSAGEQICYSCQPVGYLNVYNARMNMVGVFQVFSVLMYSLWWEFRILFATG